VTGSRASVGPPWFGRYTVPLALVLVLLAGLGPVAAWRRTTAANLRRALLVPGGAALVTLVVLLAVGDVARRPAALAMFCLGAFVLAVVGQEFWRGVGARRAMSSDSVLGALISLVQRNRRRYGGYIVHAGIVVLLVGVAASSTFQSARDVKLAPGESTRVGGYDVTYVRPTGDLDVASNGSLEKINLGADLRVRRGGGKPTTLHTERSYFPSSDPRLGPVSRYFEGEATSEVGLRPGLRRDFWTTVAPDTGLLRRTIRRGDRVFEMTGSLSREERGAALGVALRRLAASYPRVAPPATFRILVSPLVTWLWVGALIVFAGGLITLWPAPLGAPRRVSASNAARLAREAGRAWRQA
jgi:cytochrome c-type biogenesis protein CcmF